MIGSKQVRAVQLTMFRTQQQGGGPRCYGRTGKFKCKFKCGQTFDNKKLAEVGSSSIVVSQMLTFHSPIDPLAVCMTEGGSSQGGGWKTEYMRL